MKSQLAAALAAVVILVGATSACGSSSGSGAARTPSINPATVDCHDPTLTQAQYDAACGPAHLSTESATTPSSAAAALHDKSDIVKALHLRTDDDGLSYSYVSSNGLTCDIAVVMTDQSEVDLYADAGDVVAKNPAGTAGVKIVTAEEKSCLAALTEALKAVP